MTGSQGRTQHTEMAELRDIFFFPASSSPRHSGHDYELLQHVGLPLLLILRDIYPKHPILSLLFACF
jgi:hypothetical protein